MASNDFRYAGDSSSLSFQTAVHELENKKLNLVIFHNLGICSLSDTVENCIAEFQLPKPIYTQSGHYAVKLYNGRKLLLKAPFTIMADTMAIPEIEALTGPKQILTGGEDYTAVISTTLDSLDNPWPAGTHSQFDYVFRSIKKSKQLYSKPLYSYHRFYSDNEAGNATISVISKGGIHKEFDLVLYPNFPEDFTLIPARDHPYADGKQVTEIQTSIIKDRFGNVISDGTIVNFTIQPEEGMFQSGIARVVGGVAMLKIPAPPSATTLRIVADVEGFAKSNTIDIAYKESIQPFTSKILKSKKIEIGPIRGFIDQIVPDHTAVSLSIFQDGELHKNIELFTKNGRAFADTDILNLEPCSYEVVIKCAGQQNTLILKTDG